MASKSQEATPTPEASESPSISGTGDDVELDAVQIEPEAGEAEAPAEPSPEESAAIEAGLVGHIDGHGRKVYLVSRDGFYAGFCKAQKMAGLGLGLKTFVLAPESDEGREASDAIYDTAAETPALHWMLNPGGKWIPRLAAICMYSMVLKAGLAQEAKARKAAKTAAAEPEAEEASSADPGEDMATV